jgi:hypothetical protein
MVKHFSGLPRGAAQCHRTMVLRVIVRILSPRPSR